MARFWFALLFVLLISYHVVAGSHVYLFYLEFVANICIQDTPSDVKLRQLIEQATKEAQMVCIWVFVSSITQNVL